MSAASRRRSRALRAQARSLCVAPREPVRRQRRHGLVAAATRQDAALLQRHRDHRSARGRLAQVPVPWRGADHPVLDGDARVREVHDADRGRGDLQDMRALVVIDGEHYAPVVLDALAALPYDVAAGWLAGGSEKLRGGENYGVPLVESLEARPSLERLLELSRSGRHAASDYLETAALAGVPTIGCRRCGGGLAGTTGESNVLAGAALAAERGPDVVVFDGSGAAIPPVAVDGRVLVTSSSQPVEVATGYLNAYRILISDLVVVTGGASGPLLESIAEVKDVPVLPVELRPRPVEPVTGRRVAYFSTAPGFVHEPLAALLAGRLCAAGVHVSGNLARRDALSEELERVDADVYLVEIKAAAIDVVAETALERGRELVFADNELVGEGVDDHFLALMKEPVPQ